MIRIDRIIRSQRKTVALVIEQDGSLTVRAPLRLSEAKIQTLVDGKAAWIQRIRERSQTQIDHSQVHNYLPGELFDYLGRQYSLQITEAVAEPLSLRDGSFVLSSHVYQDARTIFEAWYRRQARLVIPSRAAELAAQHHYTYQGIRITSAHTRWGSCSERGALSFSWRLVMAPAEAIDYVIIHELVHLKIKNHSPQFWSKVAEEMPGYKIQRQWLKKFGQRLKL